MSYLKRGIFFPECYVSFDLISFCKIYGFEENRAGLAKRSTHTSLLFSVVFLPSPQCLDICSYTLSIHKRVNF